MAEKELNPKQARFVEEYLIDFNATQAAIRAGYSKKTAHVQGHDLLKNPKVSRAIELGRVVVSERCELSQDMVLNGFKEVAERCLQPKRKMKFDFATRSMLPVSDDEGHPVFEFDAQGANRALEMLGKHLGIFEKDNSQTFQAFATSIMAAMDAQETAIERGGSLNRWPIDKPKSTTNGA